MRTPKSTLSHRIQQLEDSLGLRLLNRTSRKFGMTDAGEDFYRHAIVVLREAELAENAVRHRLSEPSGTIRCTGGVATMQFAMTGVISDFLIRHPRVNIVVRAVDRAVDIVGENFDIAIRAHSGPLPDSNLVQRTLAPAPWFLFAGSDYLAANGEPHKPQDLRDRPSLFMMRNGVDPIWRLRPAGKSEQKTQFVLPLSPRLLSDDEIGLQEAAIKRLGIVALPAYICNVRSNRAGCDGCRRTGPPATPRSPRSFPIDRDCCPRFGLSSIIWQQSFPKPSGYRSSNSLYAMF